MWGGDDGDFPYYPHPPRGPNYDQFDVSRTTAGGIGRTVVRVSDYLRNALPEDVISTTSSRRNRQIFFDAEGRRLHSLNSFNNNNSIMASLNPSPPMDSQCFGSTYHGEVRSGATNTYGHDQGQTEWSSRFENRCTPNVEMQLQMGIRQTHEPQYRPRTPPEPASQYRSRTPEPPYRGRTPEPMPLYRARTPPGPEPQSPSQYSPIRVLPPGCQIKKSPKKIVAPSLSLFPSPPIKVTPDRKLRPHGIVDWDANPDIGFESVLVHNHSNSGSDESETSTASMEPFVGRRIIATATATVTEHDAMDVDERIDWGKIEQRKKRYALGNNEGVNLKTAAAIAMPLDEMIVKNKISYTRTRRTNWTDLGIGEGGIGTVGVDSSTQTTSLQKRSRARYYSASQGTSGAPAREETEADPGSQLMRKRKREDLRAVVVDGSSVGFDYGENIHFDWKGIDVCVKGLLEHGCYDITVIVPEERIERFGMSRNEHLIKTLKMGRYLWGSWENRNHKLFAIKVANQKEAVLISNNVWKNAGRVSPTLDPIKERTVEYLFTSPSVITFTTTVFGRTLDDVLRH